MIVWGGTPANTVFGLSTTFFQSSKLVRLATEPSPLMSVETFGSIMRLQFQSVLAAIDITKLARLVLNAQKKNVPYLLNIASLVSPILSSRFASETSNLNRE